MSFEGLDQPARRNESRAVFSRPDNQPKYSSPETKRLITTKAITFLRSSALNGRRNRKGMARSCKAGSIEWTSCHLSAMGQWVTAQGHRIKIGGLGRMANSAFGGKLNLCGTCSHLFTMFVVYLVVDNKYNVYVRLLVTTENP